MASVEGDILSKSCPDIGRAGLKARHKDLLTAIGPTLLKPLFAYRTHEIAEIENGIIRLHNGDIIDYPLAAHRFAGAEAVFAAVCTVEHAADAVAGYFDKGKPATAILLEELIVETLFASTQELVAIAEMEARRLDLNIGGVLEPGIEGFGAEAISMVVNLAAAERINVSVLATGMMAPRHSLAVMIAMGKNPRRWARADSCKICPTRNRCPYRQSAGPPS